MLRSYAYFMKPKLNPVSVYFFEPKVQFSSIVNCKRELGWLKITRIYKPVSDTFCKVVSQSDNKIEIEHSI